jgi:C-terminal processing protease CtpA/Prc
MRFISSFVPALLVIGATTVGAQVQASPSAADIVLSKTDRATAIDGLIGAMTRAYVFPQKATEVEQALRAHLTSGVYDTVTSGRAFADLLTRQLQAVTRDKHLRVRVAPASGSGARRGGPPSAEEQLRAARTANYGFGRTEILEGNIGYVEIRGFGAWVSEARDTVGRIMSKLADTDALIIDLRENGGGSPQAVAFISSYLFGDTAVHLNSLYFRPADRTDDFHTDPNVPGRKFGPTKPVYVLTSSYTFSAAEEFTYNLQARGRATIVGETTGGGAHPGGTVPIGAGLMAFIPSGRAINPITKTNWEGVGVKPEIAVARDKALDAALDAARRKVTRAALPR